MYKRRRYCRLCGGLKMIYRAVLGAVLAAGCFLPAQADDMDPASTKQLHDYVLTLPKVMAYDKGYESLVGAAKADPSLKADYQAASAEHTKTMDDEVAKMTHHPRTYAFFVKQGLTKQDAVMLPLALMGGCMVAQYPTAAKGMAAQTSSQQADFCKQNQATVHSLKFVNGG